MRQTRPKRMTVAVVIAVLLAWAALASTAQAQTLTYAMAGGWDTLDPNRTTFFRVGRTMIHVVEPMLWQTGPGVFEPGLATSWEVNDDATEYRLTLREGVTFHDGTPFNAEAVRFTYDRIVDPETRSQTARTIIGPYLETEILGEHEVIVRFSRPFAPFLNSLSYPYLGIVSPTAYAATVQDEWGESVLVGTGPFKLEAYEPGSRVELVRNDDYAWAPEHFGRSGPAAFERLVFELVTEATPRVGSLLTGEAQFIEDVPTLDVPAIDTDADFVVAQVPHSGAGRALMFNFQRAPTDELAVRRAIQLASDKETMLLTVFDGFGETSCGPLTPVVPFFDSATCDMYTFDPEAARAVLDEAGWVAGGDGVRERDGDRLVIRHYYQANDPTSIQMAQVMQADLADVGIEVELNGLAGAGFLDAVRRGDHNTQNWFQSGTDPDILRNNFHSSNAGGGPNRNNYIDDEMDALLDAASAAADPDARAELYAQIQRKIMDEAVMLFYVDPVVLFAHSADLADPYFYLSSIFPYFYPASLGN